MDDCSGLSTGVCVPMEIDVSMSNVRLNRLWTDPYE